MLNDWATAPFDEVLSDKTAGNMKIPQSKFAACGKYPIIGQGKELIAGFTDDPSCLCKSPRPVIVFGDHTLVLKYIDFPFCLGADGTKVLEPRNGDDTKFLFHYLRTVQLPKAGYSRHFKFLRRLIIPIPPLFEQRRVATILDRADELRAKRRAALAQLEEMAQSIFTQMFGDLGSLLQPWPLVEMSDYVKEFQGGKSFESDDEDIRVRNYVLKVSAVSSSSFDPSKRKPLSDSYEPPPEHFVRSGDLLFSRANTTELVGAVALVEETPPNLVLPDKLWRFIWRDPSKAVPLFIWAMFQIPSVRQEIGRRATGTSGSMKNISQAKLMSMSIIKPPLEMQRAFADRLSVARRTMSKQKAALQELDDLFASLQHRAFTGAL